jgi:hypothetical protein
MAFRIPVPVHRSLSNTHTDQAARHILDGKTWAVLRHSARAVRSASLHPWIGADLQTSRSS